MPEVLRAELARPSWRRELVALGTNTDPYQWVESRYRMMPEILAALEEAETPVSVLTKSPLVMRDIEHLRADGAKRLPVSVNLSVPTLDENAWRATEPHTPSPAARLDAVAELRRRGIDSGVLIAPLMPGINDSPEQVQPIVDRAREAGATFLGGVALHLRDEVRDVFFGWLEAKRPDLLPTYEQLYADGRAYMRPEQRKRATRAVRGLGRATARRNGESRRRRLPNRADTQSAARSALASPGGETRRRSLPSRRVALFSGHPSSRSVEQALPRVLVVPKPAEPRPVPDPPGRGVVVAHLDHQLRPQRHPLEVAAAGPAARLGGAAARPSPAAPAARACRVSPRR